MDKKKATEFFQDDLQYLASQTFITLCRGDNPKAFTRDRILNLKNLILSLFDRKGRTLSVELDDIMEKLNPDESITRAGYHKRRMSLNPMALESLYQFHNKNFYNHPDVSPRLLNGYFILAADATQIDIPKTPETFEKYGLVTCDGVEVVGIQAEFLYDVLNKFVLDCILNRVRNDEIEPLEQILARVRDIIGNKHPIIVTLDRAYPSLPLMLRLAKQNIYFIIRVSSNDYKEEQRQFIESGSNDKYTDILATTERKLSHQGTRNEEILKTDGHLLTRFIRIPHQTVDDNNGCDNGEEPEDKLLVTNLPRDDFPYESFEELYHYRWQIETTFARLKGSLQLENFTGTRVKLIQQDIFATIYLHNLAEHMIRDVEDAQADRLQNNYKYPMKINRNVAYGLLKNDLIKIILEPDPQKRLALMQKLYKKMAKNLSPIRKGRSSQRKSRGTRYSNTHKRAT